MRQAATPTNKTTSAIAAARSDVPARETDDDASLVLGAEEVGVTAGEGATSLLSTASEGAPGVIATLIVAGANVGVLVAGGPVGEGVGV